MCGICIKQAKSFSNGEWFLEIGKVYEILSEDNIGYYISTHGWITKECISIEHFRDLQINQILNEPSLEM